MKKNLIIVAVIGAVLLTLGAAGFAYAQTQTPPNPETPYGGYGPGGRGMIGGRLGGFRGQISDGAYGPLHTYMIDALADAFDLTPVEIESAHADGKTLFDLAEEKGFTVEEFRALMVDARTAALNQATADGAISQEQADWMLGRMGQMWVDGYGLGSGNCDGTGLRGGMRGGGFRWSDQ